eukprot:840991-Rhodomonas_salina.2
MDGAARRFSDPEQGPPSKVARIASDDDAIMMIPRHDVLAEQSQRATPRHLTIMIIIRLDEKPCQACFASLSAVSYQRNLKHCSLLSAPGPRG